MPGTQARVRVDCTYVNPGAPWGPRGPINIPEFHGGTLGTFRAFKHSLFRNTKVKRTFLQIGSEKFNIMLLSRLLFKFPRRHLTTGLRLSVPKYLFTNAASNYGDGDDKGCANETQSQISLTMGQFVRAKVVQIGSMGAGVTIDGDDSRRGLVLTKELDIFRQSRGKHITVGDELPAYIEKVFPDGRIYVQLRPLLLDRIQGVAEQILEALECSTTVPPSIPVGDKSKPEAIQAYFYGVTKVDFKAAVGLLYRLGFVVPGETETKMHSAMSIRPNADDDTSESLTDVVGSLVHQMKATRSPVPPASPFSPLLHFRKLSAFASSQVHAEQPSVQRFIEANKHRPCTVFLTNLPPGTTKESLRDDLVAILGDASRIVDLRLQSKSPIRNAPCGCIQLISEEVAEIAAEILRATVLHGRKLVVAYYPTDKFSRYEKKYARVSWGGSVPEIQDRKEVRHQKLLQQINERSSSTDLEVIRSVQNRSREVRVFENHYHTRITTDFADQTTGHIEESPAALRERMQSKAERATQSLDDVSVLAYDGEGRSSDDFTQEFTDFDDINFHNASINHSKKNNAIRADFEQGVEHNGNSILNPKNKQTRRRNQSRKKEGKAKVYTLYLGNLSYAVEDDEVRKFVERCVGPDALVGMRVGRDESTGRGMGYAHLDFHNEDYARQVFENLHGKILHRRPVIIDRGKDVK
jgi:RNA recognition motif-containing protein